MLLLMQEHVAFFEIFTGDLWLRVPPGFHMLWWCVTLRTACTSVPSPDPV